MLWAWLPLIAQEIVTAKSYTFYLASSYIYCGNIPNLAYI